MRRSLVFDMRRDMEAPRLEPDSPGRAIVRAVTELLRKNLNDARYHCFENEQLLHGLLSGFATPTDVILYPKRTRAIYPTRLATFRPHGFLLVKLDEPALV